jgi:hypothetical protein
VPEITWSGCGGAGGCSTSERAQQDGADEREHGEHGQHIEPQGKVHVTTSRCLGCPSLAGRRCPPNDKYIALRNAGARISGACPNILIFRCERSGAIIFDGA